MQEPRSISTLELVVNEQQLQNMSQIDLSRTSDSNNNLNNTNQTSGQNQANQGAFSFAQFRKWLSRFREGFNAKMDEAKANSETKTEFVFEVLSAFSGTLVWIICFICTIILPVILFFVGLFNLDNCPDRPPLPYLVFATGFVMTASNLFNLALSFDLPVLTNHQILTAEIKNTIASILNMIFNCVVAFLYILTAYMVFTIDVYNKQQEGDTEDNSMDCNGFLYYVTFWFITLTLSLFVILISIASLFFAYNRYRLAIIRGSMPRSQATTNLNTNPNPNAHVQNRV